MGWKQNQPFQLSVNRQCPRLGVECSGGFTPPPRKWRRKAAATIPRLRHYFNSSFCLDERYSVCGQLSGQLKRKFWVKPRVAKCERFAEGV